MSKVSFRARALDASKPMPVYRACEIPDMKDFAQINRSVPQMPTGMEKEEEAVSAFGQTTASVEAAAILDFHMFALLSLPPLYCKHFILQFSLHGQSVP